MKGFFTFSLFLYFAFFSPEGVIVTVIVCVGVRRSSVTGLYGLFLDEQTGNTTVSRVDVHTGFLLCLIESETAHPDSTPRQRTPTAHPDSTP